MAQNDPPWSHLPTAIEGGSPIIAQSFKELGGTPEWP